MTWCGGQVQSRVGEGWEFSVTISLEMWEGGVDGEKHGSCLRENLGKNNFPVEIEEPTRFGIFAQSYTVRWRNRKLNCM